nr:hypothetical protein [Komagataeibacter kakiaceti]
MRAHFQMVGDGMGHPRDHVARLRVASGGVGRDAHDMRQQAPPDAKDQDKRGDKFGDLLDQIEQEVENRPHRYPQDARHVNATARPHGRAFR